MVTIDLKALIARQVRLLAIVAAIAGLVVMLGAKPAHAQYGPTSGTISANPTYYLGFPITVTVTITSGGLPDGPPFGQVDLYEGFSTIIATAQLEPGDNGTVTFTVPGSELQSGNNYLVGYYEGFGSIPAGSTSNDVDVFKSG